MNAVTDLRPLLGNIEHMTDRSSDGKNEYVHPALRNLGSVSIVLIREIVAPAVFRNSEQEITSTTLESGVSLVRAVPNKFKHRERGNGLRILRAYKAGGAYPQNRNAVSEKIPITEIFDMNAVVFGDSVNRGNAVLPVKAAVCYSDALSVTAHAQSVDQTTHNRASEDGTLFDPATKKNSTALFERHFVVPGTLMVQVISTTGRILPFEGLEHLMLSIGYSGAYGGQTSISGVNVRSHFAGIYGSRVERPETSPYVLVEKLIASSVDGRHVAAVADALHGVLAPIHEVVVARPDVEEWRDKLLAELLGNSKRLRESYTTSKGKIGELFQDWFGIAGAKAA